MRFDLLLPLVLVVVSATVCEFYLFFLFLNAPRFALDKPVSLGLLRAHAGLYFVVAFSSSLDVAAIEMAWGRALDLDHELQTVGWSNWWSGVFGGFPGSYIFSQTLFTLRTGVHTRLVGGMVILVELLVVLGPWSPGANLPNVFLGSVLTFIAMDLMLEWLVRSRNRLPRGDYLVVWWTFGAICALGLIQGMLAGVIASALQFVVLYSSRIDIERHHARSGVLRQAHERQLLRRFRDDVVAVRVCGYVFFGCALRLRDTVLGMLPPPVVNLDSSSQGDADGSAIPAAAAEEGPRFLILDFQQVTGIDATAVRSCLLALQQQLDRRGVQLALAAVGAATEHLLRAHHVIGEGRNVALMGDLEAALEWAEDRIIERELGPAAVPAPLLLSPTGKWLQQQRQQTYPRMSLDDIFGSLLDLPKQLGPMLAAYFELRQYGPGETVFRVKDTADEVFFVESGEVSLFKPCWDENVGKVARPTGVSSGRFRGSQ